MYTYQDFLDDKNMRGAAEAARQAIAHYRSSEEFRTALDADEYDRQRNVTISRFVKKLYDSLGHEFEDRFSASSRICSAFFSRLNTQRMTYSLGNGITFAEEGVEEKLGKDFDTKFRTAAYYALIHGVSYLYWNIDHVHVYKATQFAPLWDEETGTLMGGVRWWQVDHKKPVRAVLYELEGFTTLKGERDGSSLEIVDDIRPYRTTIAKTARDAEPEVVGEENYNSLPIIPLYGSRLKQSTLVGMQGSIDAYDLVRSGFADDLQDCAQIYWLLNNAGGMTENDVSRFRDKLKLTHIAVVPNADEVTVTPYTQEIPYQARQAFLTDIKTGIYEGFGGMDVHTVSANATATEINAAYQPLDEQADDFEYQLIEAIQKLLELLGVEGTPLFKRNRICNQKEQTDMIMECSSVLDTEAILNHLPFLTHDEVEEILKRSEDEQLVSFGFGQEEEEAPDEESEEEPEEEPEENEE